MMRDRIRVLLDTDPGSDIDDAICIGYLLSQPRCDLVGITTVTGEPVQRARLASAVCRRFGRDVPIFPGCAEPWLRPAHQATAPQAECLPHWPHQEDFAEGEHLAFMRRVIRENPGEIELLAIGALTNVASLFVLDPEIPSLLRGLTIMGGRFSLGIPVGWPVEHNIVCDPHAAQRVAQERGVRQRWVGLDVTLQVIQSREEIEASFGAQPNFGPILAMAGKWFEWVNHVCYHDIVAAATIFDESLCGFRSGQVRVEGGNGDLAPFTHFAEDEAGPHEVAATVDREAFLDHFCTVTGCARV